MILFLSFVRFFCLKLEVRAEGRRVQVLLASAVYKSKKDRAKGGEIDEGRSSSSSPVEVPERLRDPPVLEGKPLGSGPRGEHALAVKDDGGAAAEQGLFLIDGF